MSKSFGLVAVIIVVASTIVGGLLSETVGARRGLFNVSSLPSAVDTSTNTTAGTLPRFGSSDREAASRISGDYQAALGVVSSAYAGEIDYEQLNEAAVQGMLSTLDPHSSFFTRAEFKKLRQEQESRFYGIGVTILRHRDGVYVQSPVEGTPAARAGLRYGDRIVEVNNQDAREWTGDQVSRNVRGERGTTVQLKVERAGSSVAQNFSIVRDSVPLPSIRSAFMIRPATGYIGLGGGFTQTTGEELRSSLSELKRQGMRQIVLDLRNNPGGLLDQAISVSGQFLPRGLTVVSVRSRDFKGPRVYTNTESDPEDAALIVLINRNSASASEIVAGAIQDHARGLVVGETSFGKGLVQRVFPLAGGTGLTLTTAKYYTPYGRLIQRNYSGGSLYDYLVRHSADDEPRPATPPTQALPVPPPGTNPAAIPAPTPLLPTGPSVKTALGRVFYGGGGITPDIPAKPLDLTLPTRGRIYEAAFYFTRELAAGQLSGLESYRVEAPLYGKFARPNDYPITERVLEAFRSYVNRNSDFQVTPRQIDADLEFAKVRLREDIITAAFSREAADRVLLDFDPQVLRALEVIPEAKRLTDERK